nr:LysM domain-containing protein [Thiocystis violacea]
MKRRFAVTSVLVCSLLTLLASGAQAVELAPDAPETYVVQPGDTLWGISGRFLRDPWRWSEVWRANPGIENPNLIYPGDVLEVTWIDGQPRIGRSGGASTGRGGARVVKLSPQVRSSSLTEAIPTIRISTIAPFLTQPYVADADDIKRASYVVGFPDEHIVAGVNDSIYVRKIRSSATANFQVLRPGDALHDPDTNELLGYEAAFVANAALERLGDPAKLKVTRMEREVSIGDRVIPADAEKPLENFFPRPAPAGSRGRIISVMNGVSQIGQFDVVILNRGTRDRIELGHVFEIFIGGEKERDQVRAGIANNDWLMESPFSSEFWLGRDYDRKGWRRDEPDPNSSFPIHADYRRDKAEYVKPFERSGTLMVFRVFDRVSFGLILDTSRALKVGDWIAPPPS